MKAFTILLLVTAFSFLARVKPEGLRPRNVVVPAHPQNTIEEWNPKMAAQLPSPKYFPSLTNDTKSEPAGTIYVSDADRRITNGIPASRGQFPWQVAILIDSSFFCGGSLISNRWILTAAHCTYNRTTFIVTLGTVHLADLDSGSVQTRAGYRIVHSEYDAVRLNNDIALLGLLTPVDFSLYISPVRLPSRSVVPSDFVGETVRSSGWGRITDLSPGQPDTLRYVDMTVIENRQCMETFGSGITPTKICVSTDDRKSICHGDSGGPLLVQEDDGRYTEIGISSFVHKSGCELLFPAVFTRVTSYLEWIEQNTGIVIA